MFRGSGVIGFPLGSHSVTVGSCAACFSHSPAITALKPLKAPTYGEFDGNYTFLTYLILQTMTRLVFYILVFLNKAVVYSDFKTIFEINKDLS